MSALTGKGQKAIKKLEVRESRIPAIGFNKIRFLHKMTAGATSISLTSLTAPSLSEAPNYSAPNVSQLTAVNLAQFPDNLELVSSVRGRLMRNMAFDIAGASTITLLFEAEENEIIEGKIDPVAITGNTIVDAKPIVATGTLTAGTTDFNVGEPFEVGKFPLTQHGSVLVFVDNQLMLRNTGNQAPGVGVEGDYYEVHAGAGLGTIIRLNTPDLINDRNVSVISVAALAERPNGSMMAFIESVNGKVDSLIPTVAALAEVDESTFGGVSNVDLKAFGDRVLTSEELISQLLQAEVLITQDSTSWACVPANLSGFSVEGVIATYSRVGDKLKGFIQFRKDGVNGASGSIVFFPLPPGLTVNFSKITPTTPTTTSIVGNVYSNNANVLCVTVSASLTNSQVYFSRANTPGTAVVGTEVLANQGYSMYFEVPIAEWAVTQTLAEQLGI
jgi:hypothetical protein